MRNCQKCGSKKWLKTNETEIVDGFRVRVWKCGRANCPHKQAEESPFIRQEHSPKKLYFDIEYGLSKFLAFDRRVRGEWLSMDSMIEEGHVLCWAAAWLDDTDEFQYIHSMSVTQDESLRHDDSRILAELWSMLDLSDFWVGHNSDQYDVKLVRYRFDKHGMGFPYKAKKVDSLKLARKYMKAPSFKLDDLTGGGKQAMEREDWKQIALTGSPEHLLKMETYCRHDVRIGAEWLKGFIHNIEMSGERVWK